MPRRRPKKFKLGDARMEVAVEHLSKNDWGMGFDEKTVRKVAGQLLKEYDVGHDSWRFIEENNYEVLVKAILEYLETNDHGGSSSGVAEIEGQFMLSDKPNEKVLAIYGELSGTAGNFSQDDTTVNVDDPRLVLPSPPPPPAAADTLLVLPSPPAAADTRLVLPFPESDKSVVIQPREPCYGWIDENDEEEKPQLVLMTPGGQVSEVRPGSKTEEKPRKRRSTWEVKTEDS